MTDNVVNETAEAAPAKHPPMRWYTLHVYSTMEKSVARAVQERIDRSEYRDLFGARGSQVLFQQRAPFGVELCAFGVENVLAVAFRFIVRVNPADGEVSQ